MREPETGALDGRNEFVFMVLAAIFIASLVVCNLIANKFVTLDVGFHVFTVSAGILPYPFTFLVTDVLSELYGRRRANVVVASGFVASLFVLGVLWLGGAFPAIADSPVDDPTFARVFGTAWRVIGASMLAYLAAQFLDVRLFHFWRDLTNGRHLWLRNNASTIVSQLVDTALVVGVLFVGVKPAGEIGGLVVDGWAFKILCALLDTPLFYLAVLQARKAGLMRH